MLLTRVIPVLLIIGEGLYKTVKFKKPVYVGDPINAIKIFNEKEVDELLILDIEASIKNTPINYKLIEKVASEAFMPVGYGGGVKTVEDAKRLFALGVEKIIINSAAVANPEIISEISEVFGNQSVVVSVDVKKNIWGKYEVFGQSGTIKCKRELVDFCENVVKLGCGELFVNSIDRDGTMKGYDLDLIKTITKEVNVPVVACGGAGDLSHFAEVINEAKASAVAAGSMFVFHGKHRAVLITYPKINELEKLWINE